MKINERIFILVLIIVLINLIIVKMYQNFNEEKLAVTEKSLNENNVNILEDGTKINTSAELIKDKMIDELLITNIQLTNRDGQSILLADVKNISNTTSKLKNIDVILLDEQKHSLAKISGTIPSLNPQEKTQFKVSTINDYLNAYNIIFVKK